MADVTSCEKARGSRGMSAGSFSRGAAGNLQNVVVFRRLLSLRKILVLGTNATKMSAGPSVANYGNKSRPFRLEQSTSRLLCLLYIVVTICLLIG